MNKVVTEVAAGPDKNSDGKRILSKLTGLGRASNDRGHLRQGSNEEIEMHSTGEGNEIVVSYDVWRTVEEVEVE